MKPSIIPLAILLWGLNANSFSYPMMHSGQVLGTPTDNATRILRDSKDNNVYYIPPKRVILADDPFTKKKLFRLSYSSVRKDGELFAVFKLGFDLEQVAAEWERISASNPQASLKMLPIVGGVFGLEFDTGEFKLLIGEAEIVETDIAAGVIPIYIKISQVGLNVLKAHSQMPGQKLLILKFDYKTQYQFRGQDFLFSVNPRRLLADFLDDPRIKAAWKKSERLAKLEIKKYLLRSFAQQLWFVTNNVDKFNLNLAAYLFYQELVTYLKAIMGESFEMNSQKEMGALSLNDIHEQTITLKGIAPGEVKTVSDSAAMVLSGVCEHYADAVFIEETGESRCFEFPLSKTDDVDDEPWVPDF
ncbi:MAG: hypothetical protein ABFS56_01310 [Pseudomonadota bacterium]